MMIEQNTNYAYKLKYMGNPTFDKVRGLAVKFYRELPQELQDELHEALNHGVDILDSEPQMTAYLFAFGKMHQAKLIYAYDQLPKSFINKTKINIIDYGCGQSLGTMCYADFMHKKGLKQLVNTITLIDPSGICLERAALHTSVFFPNANIKTINKKFDDLTKDDICCDEKVPTLHILSNVLDLLNFDLKRLTLKIKNSICGYNVFVCVGPYFNYSNKDNRMKSFCTYLNGKVDFFHSFDKGEFIDNNSCTAQILCFSTHSFIIKKEISVSGLKKKQGSNIDIIHDSVSGKYFFVCGKTDDGKNLVGSIGPKALDSLKKGVIDIDKYRIVYVSMDGSEAIPVLMLKNNNII